MTSQNRASIALAAASLFFWSAEPGSHASESDSDRSTRKTQTIDDCSREIRKAGILRHLPSYEFERTEKRTEIESAVLPNGVPLTILYSGCDHASFEYRFALEFALEQSRVLERASQLMRIVAESTSSRNVNALASDLEKATAEGKYRPGDDLTGGLFEEYQSIGVSLKSTAEFPNLLVVKHHFSL